MTKSSKVPFSVTSAGATTAVRWIGGTASGSPTGGPYVTGDWVIAQNGHLWICSAGGSPGTWVDASAGGASPSPATTVTSGTAFGTAAAVGTATTYAREDHQHGTHAALTAADIAAGVFPVGTNTFQAATSGVGLVVKAAATTPGDIQEWKNNGGSTLALLDSLGFFYAPGIGDVAATGSWFSLNPTGTDSGAVLVKTRAIGNIGVAVRATSGQTASLAEFQSSGAVSAFTIGPGGGTTIQTADGAQTLSLRARLTANGGQSANLLEFRDVSGSAWTSVDTTGNISSLVSISGSSMVAGNNLGTQGTLILNKTGPATSGTTTQNSALSKYRTAYWSGAVSTDDELTLQAVRASTTPGDIDLTLLNGRFKTPTLTVTGTATAVNLTVTGTTNIGNKYLWSGSRSLPGAGNSVDLGTFTSLGGAGAFQVNLMITVDVTGFAITKSYEVDVTAAVGSTNTWYRVIPQDSTVNGTVSPDFILEVNRLATNQAYTFRIRQVGGTTGSIWFQAEGYGSNQITYTPSLVTTSAVTAAATYWSPTPFFSGPSKVGINTDAPATELDVSGAVTVTRAIPTVFFTDGASHTGQVSIASAANDVNTGSAAGDMVLMSTTGKVYVPGNIGAVGQIASLGTMFGSNVSATGVATTSQNASRYVGATTGGAPTDAFAYVIGDWVVDRSSGAKWVCVVAGSPGTWVPSGGGVIARLTPVTANVNLGAAGAEVTCGTQSANVVNGHKYRVVSIYNSVTSTVVNDEFVVRLYAASTQLQSTGRIRVLSANLGYGGGPVEATYIAASTASVSFTVRSARVTGTGTGTLNAAATTPLELYIEDVGTA